MPPDVHGLTLALATFLTIYALLAGRRWLPKAIHDPRKAHRTGMVLNLVRRAGPAVFAGLLVLVVGGILGRSGHGPLAAALIAGGFAYGFHRGLAELGYDNSRSLGFRLVLTVAVTLGVLWQTGVL